MNDRRAWTFAIGISLICWMIAVQQSRMSGGMPMPGGWTMSMGWMVMPGQSIAAAAAMFLSMWTVMMVAMMLPSVLPVVLLYRGLARARSALDIPMAPEAILLAGYFAVWAAFGAVVFAIGFWFATLTMSSTGLSRFVPLLSGMALVLAGAYQMTPLKRACLDHCRSPMSFLGAAWREGWLGAFRLGVHHAGYCTACCWALMVVLVVTGVMNVWIMMLIAGIIALEKGWHHGRHLAHGAGIAIVAVGALQIVAALARE